MKIAVITAYYNESREILQRCLSSVKDQALPVDHIFVADGYPQDWLDDCCSNHIKLGKNNSDYGDTPRAVGFLVAMRGDYDVIQFLDADNTILPEHFSLVQENFITSTADVLIARRFMMRTDGTRMPINSQEDIDLSHVDTSCYVFGKNAFHVGLKWAYIPKQLSCIGDRVFYSILISHSLSIKPLDTITVGYTCLIADYYIALNEPVPESSKNIIPEINQSAHWFRELPQEDKRKLEVTLGIDLSRFFLPMDAESLCNHGITLKELGRLEEAEENFSRALAINPDSIHASFNLGLTLMELGRSKEAEVCYRRVLEINPNVPEAHNNIGIILYERGQLLEAEACYRRALTINPLFAVALSNLGSTLKDLGLLEEAEACCLRALEINPDLAEAQNNLGNTLKDLGRLNEAEVCYRRAVALKPEYAEALSNLGNTLKDIGRLNEAEAIYRQALERKPGYTGAQGNLLYLLCTMPLISTEQYFCEAQKYGHMVTQQALTRFSEWCCDVNPGKLKIGMVSGDFRCHSVGFFLESLINQLDSSSLDLVAYSTNYNQDELTHRIMPHFGTWKSLVGLNDNDAVQLIHADGVHILIDLSGHTGRNRLPLFAWKPAPVQATWLGYLASTGVAEIDYIIGDPQTTPPEHEGHFTEKVWRMPDVWACFSPPSVSVEPGPLPALSAGYVTFGSFNYLPKMNDSVVALWSRVLHAVPNSRLFLKTRQLLDPVVCEATRQRFAACGIAPERLLLEGNSPRAELLDAYKRVDIALDPFPYGGGTTTYEALWMAVPVITLAGDCFLSRCGQSLAFTAGLADWIAVNEDGYVATAVAHTQDLATLGALRSGLRQQVLNSPLYDAARFARNFEAAMWGMWQEVTATSTVVSSPSLADSATMSLQHEVDLLVSLCNQSRYVEAESYARQKVELSPQEGFFWKVLGVALFEQGRCEESRGVMERAVELLPMDAEAVSNLGNTLHELGRLNEAEACCRRALEIRPAYAEALGNLGNTLFGLDLLIEAEASCRHAVEIKPDYALAQNTLGAVLKERGLLNEAEAVFRRVLEINPEYAEAQSNLGLALGDLGRLAEAEACFRRALALNPFLAMAHSNLLFAMCNMSGNHYSLYLEEVKKFGLMVAHKASTRFTDWFCNPHPVQLTVGIVSGDFRNHPVGFFLESMLASIDPSRIKLIAYPTNYKSDELTERIKPYFTCWKSIAGLRDEAAAQLIREDGVHILLDVAGHSAHNRLPVFAWKPAPVQATWLGYLASSGVAEMDYLIGDPQVTPVENDGHFTEKVWRMPEIWACFSPPSVAVACVDLPALANGYVTFGCFNNLTKMNDGVVELWSKVLHAVPSSRLFLKTKQLNDPLVCEYTLTRFASHGITEERVQLEGGSPRAELLQAYNRIDIALDPFPYGGGTTTYEALWMAVPVLTRSGTTFLSRCGQSLNVNAGLGDWVALDEEEYVSKAVGFANDVASLAALRKVLRQQVLESPLFDAPRFARNLETALWAIWEDKCRLKPLSVRF